MNAVVDLPLDGVRDLMRRAGAEAQRGARRRRHLTVETKANPLDPVTETDLAVERLIRDELARMFSNDRFWGEECGRPDEPAQGRVWICDPIDGTRSFLRLGHDYCVSLGLLVGGEPVIGLIFDPERDDLYEARTGQGAFLNGERIGLKPLPDLSHGLVALGYSERVSPERHAKAVGEILKAGAMTHQHGSGALALAQVAAGRLDAYLELHMNPWDALPGLLIASEAGASCLAWMPGDLLRGSVVLAANPGIALSLARIAIGPKTPQWGVTASADLPGTDQH